MTELGRLHAPLLGDAALADAEWLNRESPMNQALIAQLYAGFVERYGDDIAPDASRGVRAVGRRLRRIPRRRKRQRIAFAGLVHGDYRLDNMLFGQPGADRPLTVVDWQTVTWGPAMTDVAYFLGCALPDRARAATTTKRCWAPTTTRWGRMPRSAWTTSAKACAARASSA